MYTYREKASGKTQKDFGQFKKDCNEFAPIIKSVNIGSMNIISANTVELTQIINGAKQTAQFEMTPDALKDLMKAMGLTYGVYSTFIETIGANATATIIEAIRTKILNEEKKNKITLVVSSKTHKIVGFSKYKGNTINNETYFSLVEKTLNGFENSGMRIKNMTFSDDGNIAITVLNDNWEFDLQGLQSNLNDEYFKSGMTIIKTPTKIVINPFNERLICLNGMVDVSNAHAITLNSTEPKAIEAFFEKAISFGKSRNSFETAFKQRVIKMLSTNASFAELLKAYNSVKWLLDQNHERSNILLNNDFHIHDIKKAFENKFEVNLFQERVKYQEKIITDYNMWELVNKLTFIASNPYKTDYEFNTTDSAQLAFRLQRTAGEFTFKQHYDLGLSVPQLFEANAAKTNAEIISKLKNSMK